LQKLSFNVSRGMFIIIGFSELREADSQRNLLNLFIEQVALVEKENHGSFLEITRVTDFIEEIQGFVHTVGVLIFVQDHVVFTESSNEEASSNFTEAVDPFLAFVTLPSDVIDLEVVGIDDEAVFDNTGSTNS